MNFAHLDLFIHVVRCGSFAAAARALNVDPSVISKAIKQLESELGFRLFHRSTRSIALTSSGEHYLRKVEPLLDGLYEAGDFVLQETRQPSGKVRLTASVAFGQICLLPLLQEFRLRYPGVQLECVFSDAVVDLISENVDMAFRLGTRVDPNLFGRKVMDLQYCVCASPQFLSRYPSPEKPLDIQVLECLSMAMPGYRDCWYFQGAAGAEAVMVKPAVTFSSALALREAALMGMGVALLANVLIEDELQRGQLINIFPEHRVYFNEESMAAWLVYPSRTHVPARVRLLMDFLLTQLSIKYDENESRRLGGDNLNDRHDPLQ